MSIRKNSLFGFALNSLFVISLSFGAAYAAFAQSLPVAARATSASPLVIAPTLVELTAANANDLLVNLHGKSFIIAYSSKESTSAQQQQINLIAREGLNYGGQVNFLRLDVDKYPEVFAALSNNRKWDHGPYFFIVSNNPNYIAIISDNFNGASDALHSISSVRLHEEINNYLKIQPTTP